MLTDAEWCKNDAGNQDWKDAAEFEACRMKHARIAVEKEMERA